MSRENVELARRGYEAFARRDLDAVFELFHPDIEAHDPPEMPDAAIHRGHEAVLRDWQQTYELFDEFSIEVEKLVDCGEDVIVYLRYRGRGNESGAEVDASMAHVWTVHNGKATRLRQFLDASQAHEAVGLRE
jgi:ketosteroid isomerase-like protein